MTRHVSTLHTKRLETGLLLLFLVTAKLTRVVAPLQMSFKEIIHHYRQQPQAHSDVFRTVVIERVRPRRLCQMSS